MDWKTTALTWPYIMVHCLQNVLNTYFGMDTKDLTRVAKAVLNISSYHIAIVFHEVTLFTQKS